MALPFPLLATLPGAGLMQPVDVAFMVDAGADVGAFEAFADRLAQDVEPALEDATGLPWRFHRFAADARAAGTRQRPSDFLEEASMRMVSGPYDLVVVLTDGPLVARRLTAGAVSSVARVIVVSAWKLRTGPREEPQRPLESEVVRWNAASLLLHLIGSLLGAKGLATDVMRTWRFDAERHGVAPFDPVIAARIGRAAARFPDKAISTDSVWRRMWFHLQSAWGNPRQALAPVLRSRAPLLPLALPRLSTAAVVPVFVLMFSAEMWDVGMNMGTGTAILASGIAIVASTAYLVFATDLLFPRGDRRRTTEHMAVVNAAIMMTMFAATVGLFVMLFGLILAVIVFLFPQDLAHTWPTAGDREGVWLGSIRVALFVSSLGTVTGALAGGLEDRMVIRQLSLFGKET